MIEVDLLSWDGRDVAELLDLARLGGDIFRSRGNETNEHGRIFGGQMLGQALAAAALTVPEDRQASYLQFLFAAGGRPERPIDYKVTALQDGRRFASRNVRGLQPDGRILCDAGVSFARGLESPSHQSSAPDDCGLTLDPERLPRLEDIDAPEVRDVERTLDYLFRPHSAIDIRAPFVGDLLRANSDQPRMRFWIRLRRPIGDGAALHAAAFAYLSDYWINFVACAPHVRNMAAVDAKLYVASLNHTIWFHRPLRADHWMLFDCVSPSGAAGRGLATARIYSPSGEILASVAQECLLALST